VKTAKGSIWTNS